MSGDISVLSDTVTVPASPGDIAGALRRIADRVEGENLCLIGLWVAGFGEPWEATIQYVFETADV